MHKEFSEISQRPFPLPRRPWIMTQEWNDLLFSQQMFSPFRALEFLMPLFDEIVNSALVQ